MILCLAFSASSVRADRGAPKAPRIEALRVLESYTLPAVEVSGAAWRTNPETKRRELVIVGDRDHKIYLIDWENRKTAFAPREVDLKPLETKGGIDPAQSEWESVFSDETGRLFIVQEHPAQIVVISADLAKIESRFNLKFPPVPQASGTAADTNSGGEGLMPLGNGHILIVKEKDPLQIIEFAPPGQKAAGYRTELSIEKKGFFPVPKTPTLEYPAVFSWRFAPEHEALFEDSSGLNVDEKGALYLLSDQRNMIGRIGKKLKKDKALIQIERLWSLPSKIRQPEGMVIDEQDRPIIAVDRKNTKDPNLFLLTPLR